MGELTEAQVFIPNEEKGYRCEIVLDSISPAGVRLVTMRWKYPLMVHAEACRHRAFSRSVASSRAIPTPRLLAMVMQDPVIPVYWGRNRGGMQATEELEPSEQEVARYNWLWARDAAVDSCRRLHSLGIHKQIANRVLAPFQWVTEIVTATDWANFFGLRIDPAAQPEIRRIAEMALEAFNSSTPQRVGVGQWHLPFVTSEDYDAVPHDLFLQTLQKISAARVARTSYRTHEGKVSGVEEDLTLYTRLVGSRPIHASPTEHLATPIAHFAPHLTPPYCGNLRGWRSHRYEIAGHTIAD